MDVVVISPISPLDPRDGHRLAVLSDLHAALDNHLQLGLITFMHGEEEDTIQPLCATKRILAQTGGLASRFIRGLFTGFPPSAERLYGSQARREVRETLLGWKPSTIIIDDSLVAGYIPLIRETLPNVKVILRSHNVMHDVRLEQLRRTKGITRPAIRFDCNKYIEFERKAVESADAHWAITDADATRMVELYGRPTSCLTVSLPLEKYESLRTEDGRSNGFVHVGTLDFRRRSHLSNFLGMTWPKVLEVDGSASLTLAGALYGGTIPARNVHYLGRVPSDTDVYRLGRFALNFQSSTGGVKLKTLISMAAGRALVSTVEGVEGLPIESGRQYWDITTFVSSPQLKDILSDCESSRSIADEGRQYVAVNHSRAAVARQFAKLIEAA